MGKRSMSLRTAIILPFIMIMAIIVLMFVLFWRQNYVWMTKDQGGRLLNSISENTEQMIRYMLLEPQRVNAMYGQVIIKDQLYESENLEALQIYTLDLLKTLRRELPQVSAVSLGNENSEFLGYRMSDDRREYNLMLQDSRTDGILNIYEGETLKANVLSAYEGYDPTVRPWYVPVKENPEPQWSDIYINLDEKNEATISSLMPIIDETGQFRGVSDVDVKLSGINERLVADTNRRNGVIFIVNEEWQLIAQSNESDSDKTRQGVSDRVELIQAMDSGDEIIKIAAEHLQDNVDLESNVAHFPIGSEKYFVIINDLKEPASLHWKVVVVIPESDLMGMVKGRQNATVAMVLAVIFLATIGGMIILNRIIKPILESAEVALQIADGDWTARVGDTNVRFIETEALIKALNAMSVQIQAYFNQITVSKETYQSLVENVENMIYTISPEGKYLSVNSSFERSAGKVRSQIIGKDIDSIFEDEMIRQFWKDVFNRICLEREVLDFQYDFTGPYGKRKYLNVNLIPLSDDEGNLLKVLGSNTDITDLVQAQQEVNRLIASEKETLEFLVKERTQELEMAMNELVEKEKMASLGSLVSGISHEINTPLGVAVSAGSYMDALYREAKAKLESNMMTKSDFLKFLNNLEESIVIINSNLNRAAELVKSFKEIAVKQSLEGKIRFNLYNYLQATVLSLKHEYKNSAHNIVISCDKMLEIESFPGAFSQILTNLVMNSIIHGFEGRKNGNINIELSLEEEVLKLTYRDDGKGIDEAHLSKVFDPFFTTNRSRGGSGLGLNIVYNIVTSQLGGRIKCESTLGEGTCFEIEMDLTYGQLDSEIN